MAAVAFGVVERDDGGAEGEALADADAEAFAEADALADAEAEALAEADASAEGEVDVTAAESDPEEPVHPVSKRTPPSTAAAIGAPLNPDNSTLLLGR
ncbi:hypothetical protein [Actinacidiphila glaucinigra]|uniref:hypothetical protein n=1 Tax=Actinacidiphila glaucinigra TaxID=235986 RepID=UPI002E2EDF9E|nr:hypothetical protein [Actinacidiphila glaucinigra]